MKKLLSIAAACISLATLAWVQVNPSSPRPLASLMPSGPMIYLEAKDFHSLLNEWNQSAMKRTWLAGANYEVFSKSNLFQKLGGAYQEYGTVAGFLPGLPGALELAGGESALGLYDLREQYFVYLTRVEESQLTKSQLWLLREKFALRQASGIPFYHRRDDASNRTVAFAFANGWLVLTTRDDLMASTLALIAATAGSVGPSRLSDESWYKNALSQAANARELRMALNMQSLVEDARFRSYWIQRNVSYLQPFDAGLVDVHRTSGQIVEDRIFARRDQASEPASATPSEAALQSVAALRAIAPADAAFVSAWAAPSPQQVQSIIEAKLLRPSADTGPRNEYAPEAVSTDQTAGSEQDLESKIDQPSLANNISGALQLAALQDLIAQASPDAILQIQTSASVGRFVRTPSVLVLSTASSWDQARVREALSSAVETLWTTARLGVEWQPAAIGPHPAEHLNGLATLFISIDGKLLFLANDSALLGATLERIGTAPLLAGPSYAAEFRHAREQADYLTIMRALDFGARAQSYLFNPQGGRTPQFFSDNLASLSTTFNFVNTVSVTHTESPGMERQTIVYR